MLEFQWLQTIDYLAAWDKQKSLRKQVLQGGPSTVLGCEHFPVITRGKRSQTESSLLDSIPSVQTDRGGLATLHNPGQLVIYPIVNLRSYELGVRMWVQLLLETTAFSLKKCNIIVNDPINGVFTENGKIASVGININKGVSTHGIAINVCNDLSLFSQFDPCGVQNQKMDKVVHYDSQMTPQTLFNIWTQAFSKRLTLLN